MGKNAFDILGATLLDNSEKINDLYEEKSLLSDNDEELKNACSELLNVKKRIKHEVEFLSANTFKPFYRIIKNLENNKEVDYEDICSAIIKVGKWFDSSGNNLFHKINESREIAGFTLINNEELVIEEINNLKVNSLQSIKNFFDSIDENDVVDIFNDLVIKENYQSFFIDDLMVYYEKHLEKNIETTQENCLIKFKSLIAYCSNIETNGAYNLYSERASFTNLLKKWDRIVQPLQVNTQRHGRNHHRSEGFAIMLRNEIIDLCNSEQKNIEFLLLSFQMFIRKTPYGNYLMPQGEQIRDNLPDKLNNQIIILNTAINLTNLLLDVFKEIEQVAEKLEEDLKKLRELKSSAVDFKEKIEKATSAAAARNHSTSSSSGYGCYIATCVYGSYDCPQVWTLRRYRDYKLASSWHGRLFIKLYYAISPTLVKWFGNTVWFQKYWRKKLNRKIEKLQKQGYEDTPYNDPKWRE